MARELNTDTDRSTMDATASDTDRSLTRRWRGLLRIGAGGLFLGPVGIAVGTAGGQTPSAASELTFLLAMLAFGFGLTTWATMLMLGDLLDSVAHRLDVSEDFSARESQIAMSVITAASTGAMLGAMVVGILLGG